jgi:hypothetical protein
MILELVVVVARSIIFTCGAMVSVICVVSSAADTLNSSSVLLRRSNLDVRLLSTRGRSDAWLGMS